MSTIVDTVIILAAGKSSRMKSDLPKVLHTLGGKPIIQYLIDTSINLGISNIYLICGYKGELIKNYLINQPIKFIEQVELLGTGHAIQQVIPYLKDNENVLILYGDSPLISEKTLKKLIDSKPDKGISLLTSLKNNAVGYGRIIRKNNNVIKIIEEKDITNIEDSFINEINVGVIVVKINDLKRWLKLLNNCNSQNEYYITDIVFFAHQDGYKINTIYTDKISEGLGINNYSELSQMERILQQEIAERLMLSGLKIIDSNRFDLRGNIKYGRNVTIDINVIIEGDVFLGNNVYINSGCILRNCIIGDNTVIHNYSLIDNSKISSNCVIGPFANLRTGTMLENNVSIGNFVELKNTTFKFNSKARHLSYLGDANIGHNVNIGAGTITCNYNGIDKFKTIIGNNVFIGANTELVAPINIADEATVGAGTTLTHDVKKRELVIRRSKQKHIFNWKRTQKK